MTLPPDAPRCSDLSASADEPTIGTAPRADLWVVVEHPDGWGDAALARAGHGVRVVLARGSRQASAHARAAGRFRVWVARAACVPGGDPTALRLGYVTDPAEVAGWDLAALAAGGWQTWGDPDPPPLLLVCANGRRDRCCGHAGGRLAERLWAEADADRVLTCTHLGGHRFSPTSLLLPWGVLHARLDLAAALTLLPDAAAALTPPDGLRGHSALAPAAQVAEAHARSRSGHRGLEPLPVALEGAGVDGRLTARVGLPDGDHVEVRLVRVAEDRILSCGRDPEPTEHWAVAP